MYHVGMGFFEGLENDIRDGERPWPLRVLMAVLGFFERLRRLWRR